MDVLLGESRTYISDRLRQELGWERGQRLCHSEAGGLFMVTAWDPKNATVALRRRGGEWYFEAPIPGVSRGRLNGSRTCKHSVQDGALTLDVRELLSTQDA